MKTRKIWERLNFGDLTFETFSAVVVHRVEEKVPGRLKIGILLPTSSSRKNCDCLKGASLAVGGFFEAAPTSLEEQLFGGNENEKSARSVRRR